MSAVVLLVRHGRTALNADGRLRGHLDPPLDDVGRTEVARLAAALAKKGLVRIVSSPLGRAKETAAAIAAVAGVEVNVDDRLIDRDYGPGAGQLPSELIHRYGSVDAAPQVEPMRSILLRARAALNDQVPWLGTGPVVLVAHDAINRALLAHLAPRLGPPEQIEQHTACWNTLRNTDGAWSVERVNDTM